MSDQQYSPEEMARQIRLLVIRLPRELVVKKPVKII